MYFKKTLVKVFLFVVVSFTACMSTAKAGLDYYKVYLGKKLIYERFLDKPLSLQSLPLSQANANEELVIYYFQCNAPDKTGSKRSIALKDGNGNKIKEWKFADSKGSNTGMKIPVKELLQAERNSKTSSLSLFYTADGRTEGEKIAYLKADPKAITFLHKQWDKSMVKQAGILLLPYFSWT